MNADPAGLARGWIGTPWRNRMARKGAGCDCLGLIVGVWRELGGVPPELPEYGGDGADTGSAMTIARELARYLPAANGEVQSGQIAVIRIRPGKPARHVGIIGAVAGVETLIHAYTAHGVIESALSEPWRRRIVARFEFPAGEY